MTSSAFDYRAMLADPKSDVVTSIAAFRQAPTGFQAIIWHATKEVWVWAPRVVLSWLFDDDYGDESTAVDRETAERLARLHLPEPLPSVERLEQMIEEAERARPKASTAHEPDQAGASDPDGLSPLQRAIRERVALVRERGFEADGEPLPPLPVPPWTPHSEPPSPREG